MEQVRPTGKLKISEEQRQRLIANEAVLLDPAELDEAIIDEDEGRAVYGFAELVAAFCIVLKCEWDEAAEWVDYNTVRAIQYLGIDDSRKPVVRYADLLCETGVEEE